MRITSEHRTGPTAPGVFRPGPRCPDNSHLEVWSNAGDWDRPEWRRADGHPDLMVRHAYQQGFGEAIAAGMALEVAHERAEANVALYLREHTS